MSTPGMAKLLLLIALTLVAALGVGVVHCQEGEKLPLVGPAIPIEVWSFDVSLLSGETGQPYMCQFVSDKYLWVCGYHCQALDENTIYVRPGHKACLIDVETGRVVKCVTGSGTFQYHWPGGTITSDVDEAGANTWFYYDGVNVTLGEILGVTSFEGYGMSCYGKICAVGEAIAGSGRMYIFDIVTRKVIYNITLGNIRRIKIAQGANGYLYVIGGSIDRPLLVIVVVDPASDTVVKVLNVTLEDGVGALDVSHIDDVCSGYIIVGGSQGWVYIFNASPLCRLEPPRLVYKARPSSNRFYNPFYVIYRYEQVNVFALKDDAHGGVGVIYDPLANTSIVIHFPSVARILAACVSPSGRYVFLGYKLYRIVRLTERPMLIIRGTLMTPAVTALPLGRGVYLPRQLLNNTYISNVRLYVQYIQVGNMKLTVAELKRPDYAHVDVGFYDRYAEFGGRMIPETLATPWCSIDVDVFRITGDTVHVSGTYRVCLGYATRAVAVWLRSSALSRVNVTRVEDVVLLLGKFGGDFYVEGSNWMDYIVTFLRLFTAPAAAAGALAVVGAAKEAAVVAGIGLAISATLAAVSSYKTILYFIPIVIVRDVETGNIYAIAYVITSRDNWDFFVKEYSDNFLNALRNYIAKRLGVDSSKVKVKLEPKIVADSNRELLRKLRTGEIRAIVTKLSLKTLIMDMVVYGEAVPLERIRIEGIVILTGFANWVTLGSGPCVKKVWRLDLTVRDVRVVSIPRGGLITSPDEICSLPVYIAGRRAVCSVEVDPVTGARVAVFRMALYPPAQVSEIARVEGMSPDIVAVGRYEVDVDVAVPCTCVDVRRMCVCSYHHNVGTMLRVREFMLVSMPAPVIFVERVYRYRYGEFRHIVYINSSYLSILEPLLRGTEAFQLWERNGNMFELANATTWGGRRLVTLITVRNTRWIDPTNGGTMQKCKRVEFRYFYGLPPDVAVKILFNGTRTVGTQPVHITVAVRSNVAQNVTVRTIVEVLRLNYTTHVLDVYRRYVIDRSIMASANETRFIVLDASPYIAEAIRLMRLGYPALIHVSTYVLSASVGDFFKANSYDNKTLPILNTLNVTGTAMLTVRVVDALDREPIPGATVVVYEIVDSMLSKVAEGTTDASGKFTVVVDAGRSYLIVASAAGYRDPNVATLPNGSTVTGITVLVIGNVTVTYVLVPETFEFVTVHVGNNTLYRPIRNETGVYMPLTVMVMYRDGAPIANAIVEVYDASSGALLYNVTTDSRGLATVYILNNTLVNIRVRYGNYTVWRNGTLVDRPLLLSFSVNETSPLFQPEVAIVKVEVRIHAGKTWYGENISHLILTTIVTNVPQTVTVQYSVYRVFTNGSRVLAVKFNRTYSLEVGTNVFYEWFNVSEPGTYAVLAEIVQYESDTDLRNNIAWSNNVTLLPYVDLAPMLLIQPVQTRLRHFIIPGDVVRICVGVRVFTNAREVSGRFRILVGRVGWVNRTYSARLETFTTFVRPFKSVVVWRNFTLTVPWARVVTITVLIDTSDDNVENNNVTYTLHVDPNVEILSVENVPSWTVEGRVIKIRVTFRNNLPPGTNVTVRASFRGIADVWSRSILVSKENETATVELRVPKNPVEFKIPLIGEVRTPRYDRELVVYVDAPDVYTADNGYNATVTVLSSQVYLSNIALLVIIVAIILALIVLALLARARKRRIIARTIGPYA